MSCIEGLLGYVRLIPCFMGEGELSAEHVAQLFFDSVVCVFGLPEEVLHDRDPRFTQTSGGICWTVWDQGLYFPQLNIPKLMVKLNMHTIL